MPTPRSTGAGAILERLDRWIDPLEAYRKLRRPGHPSVLLETARPGGRTGRYSFVAWEPCGGFRARGRQIESVNGRGRSARRTTGDPFEVLRRQLTAAGRAPVASPPGWPPFTGGAIGYVGYEAGTLLEPRLPARRQCPGDLGLPDLCFYFFREGAVFDHRTRTAYLFRHPGPSGAGRSGDSAWFRKTRERLRQGRLPRPASRARRPAVPEVSLSRAGFVRAVRSAKRYIRAGDIFQANLSVRFDFPLAEDPLVVYERLRKVNPSPFFGFFDAGDFQILSGSPERLLKLEGDRLETRPIAGTRRRGRAAREDRALERELLLSEKERAEHVMLVDLERNDLGRVAEYGSVTVDELMTIEDYSHVKHIVSNVRATLASGRDAVDALRAFFPGGTITGAPKIRCMEIIDELEPVARGPYTGSLGYLSFSGAMDMNILIRSLVVRDGRASLQAGAGIVADSIPEKEHDETLHKARAVLAAVWGERAAARVVARLGR